MTGADVEIRVWECVHCGRLWVRTARMVGPDHGPYVPGGLTAMDQEAIAGRVSHLLAGVTQEEAWWGNTCDGRVLLVDRPEVEAVARVAGYAAAALMVRPASERPKMGKQ